MSKQKIKDLSFMELFTGIKINGKVSLDHLCHDEKINDVFKFIYDSIHDNIPISFEQFKRNTIVDEAPYNTYIPVLTSYHLINYVNKGSIDPNEIPEILDFIEKHKQNNPTVLYSIVTITDTPVEVISAINNFLKTNQTYLADIIIACIVEEILTGGIPTVSYLNLSEKRFKPNVVRKMIIKIDKLSSHGIQLSQLMDKRSNVAFVDPYTLGQQKLFHMYQYAIKSFKYNDDK